MVESDHPTSIIRQESSGTFRTTIPRQHVDRLGLEAGDKLGIVPQCCSSSSGLFFDTDPISGSHVVTVKMIGPNGRQAVVNPPRKASAMLGLDGKTATWSGGGRELFAAVDITAELPDGYLGAFHYAATTRVYQRSNGQFAVNIPSVKARPLELEQSTPLRLRLRCLGENYILFGEAEEAVPNACNTVRVQMEGPEGQQARISVFKSLGDGLKLDGTPVDWVYDEREHRVLGRFRR